MIWEASYRPIFRCMPSAARGRHAEADSGNIISNYANKLPSCGYPGSVGPTTYTVQEGNPWAAFARFNRSVDVYIAPTHRRRTARYQQAKFYRSLP
jgi:hypothetical protein